MKKKTRCDSGGMSTDNHHYQKNDFKKMRSHINHIKLIGLLWYLFYLWMLFGPTPLAKWTNKLYMELGADTFYIVNSATVLVYWFWNNIKFQEINVLTFNNQKTTTVYFALNRRTLRIVLRYSFIHLRRAKYLFIWNKSSVTTKKLIKDTILATN